MNESDLNRVMVDIETLGLEPGSAILSIGAVKFTKHGLGDEFYQEISLTSCQEAELAIDAETLEWWLDQDSTVSNILTGGAQLEDSLESFSEWFPNEAEIWANSPSFDCEHLEAAFEAVGMAEPWGYRDERDVRTLRSLPCAAEIEMNGDDHNALDDAKHQAQFVSQTLSRLAAGDNTSG